MKTYLMFKRQEVIDGKTSVVTKVVPVDVPGIDPGVGWILSGHTDIIDIVEQPQSNKGIVERKQIDDKFISTVSGTAKLVRSKGVIKIVARRGKTTYNQNTPNSVCIDDETKNRFFDHCRKYHGNIGLFEFNSSASCEYDYWNKFIDEEYMRQKHNCRGGK